MRSLLVLVVACGGRSEPEPKPAPLPPAPVPVAPAPADAAAVDAATPDVTAHWTTGCFTMLRGRQLFETDRTRCTLPRRPYSTFKLANALIGLDAGLIEGPDGEMRWDAKRVPAERSWQAAWKQPKKSLRDAMKISSVPHFRTLALDLGRARMNVGLAHLHYGNQNMEGGLDRFWLTGGGLRISAAQQLSFVDALAHRELDIKRSAQDAVAAVTVLATRNDQPTGNPRAPTTTAILHGKTGSGPIEDGNGGWLVWQVGWVEYEHDIIPYAAWLESHADKLDDARAERDAALTATLDELGVFKRADGGQP